LKSVRHSRLRHRELLSIGESLHVGARLLKTVRDRILTHLLQLPAQLFYFDLPVCSLTASALDSALISFKHAVCVNHLIEFKSVVVLHKLVLLNIVLEPLQREKKDVWRRANPVFINADLILELGLYYLRLFDFIIVYLVPRRLLPIINQVSVF